MILMCDLTQSLQKIHSDIHHCLRLGDNQIWLRSVMGVSHVINVSEQLYLEPYKAHIIIFY